MLQITQEMQRDAITWLNMDRSSVKNFWAPAAAAGKDAEAAADAADTAFVTDPAIIKLFCLSPGHYREKKICDF